MVELSPNRRLFSCWALLVLLGSGGCCWRLAKAWGYLVSQPAAPRVEAEERRAVRLAANRRIQEFQRAAAERRAYAESRRRKRLRPIPNPPEWVASFSETEITGIHWAAEVLNVPPGSLSRHNSDDNTHDKEEDEGTADAAAAGVTRPAGSRPSSEEMLQRGYMLRKGDTLSCEVLILTFGQMLTGRESRKSAIKMGNKSRENHVFYAARRGYCLMHSTCVGSERGMSMSGRTEVKACVGNKFIARYLALNHTIREILVNPSDNLILHLDLDAFFTNHDISVQELFRDVSNRLPKTKSSSSPSADSQSVIFSPKKFSGARPRPIPSRENAPSLVIGEDALHCRDMFPLNAGVTIWRGTSTAMDIIHRVLIEHVADHLRDDQSILTHKVLDERYGMVAGYTKAFCREAGSSARARAGIPINWSPNGDVVAVTARTFNSFRLKAVLENRESFWRAGDFICHFPGLAAPQRHNILEDTCSRVSEPKFVCPWRESEEEEERDNGKDDKD